MDTQSAALLLFIVYTVVILAGGIMAVLSKSLVRALVGLVLTLFGVAGMYLLMAAPFIALMQILIYVGAVAVLIFFAIMLTNATSSGDEAKPRSFGRVFLALVAAALPAGLLAAVAWSQAAATGAVQMPVEVSIDQLGKALLNEYVLVFELISVVLFVAMAGAVLLGFERRKSK